MWGGNGNDAVTTGFKEKGANGEDLFIVINTEDGFLRAHAVSLLPDVTLWWIAAIGQTGTSAGLQVQRWGAFEKKAPWLGRIKTPARGGSAARAERDAEREALLSAPQRNSDPCPANEVAEPRGAREAVGRRRLPRKSASAWAVRAANTEGPSPKNGMDRTAVADSDGARWELRLRGSPASLNSNY